MIGAYAEATAEQLNIAIGKWGRLIGKALAQMPGFKSERVTFVEVTCMRTDAGQAVSVA